MITTLNIVGLLANMIGSGIAFFYGYPQPSHDTSVGLAFSDATTFTNGESVAQIKERALKQERKYRHLSKFGLGLMFLGFAFQFIALCIGSG